MINSDPPLTAHGCIVLPVGNKPPDARGAVGRNAPRDLDRECPPDQGLRARAEVEIDRRFVVGIEDLLWEMGKE